jgi:hypothetical protein
LAADAFRRAVALLGFRIVSIHLDEHGVIDMCAEGTLYSLNIDPVTIPRELDSIRQPGL